jgi:salicylate hydroxylase
MIAMPAMDIVIVGGGIAGLASALALADRRRRISIFERSATIEEHGAGVQLGPNALHALRSLGVWDRLFPKLFAPAGLQIMDALTGETIRRFCLGPRFEARFGAPHTVVHRHDLIAALRDAVLACSNVEFFTGRRVTGLDWKDDAPRLALADGELIRAAAVIGADGIRSAIRQSLFADGSPATHGCVIYRALVPRVTAPSLPSDVVLWLYPGGHVVHYPVTGGQQINLVAVITGEISGADGKCPSAEVLDRFPAMSADLRYVLGLSPGWTRWTAADRPPAKLWGQAGVTLIGDAAHPMLPYLAQGAAAALVDAETLGRCAAAETDFVTALRRYELLRKSHTSRLQLRSRRQGDLYHCAGWQARLRNKALAMLPESLFFSRIAWIYG